MTKKKSRNDSLRGSVDTFKRELDVLLTAVEEHSPDTDDADQLCSIDLNTPDDPDSEDDLPQIVAVRLDTEASEVGADPDDAFYRLETLIFGEPSMLAAAATSLVGTLMSSDMPDAGKQEALLRMLLNILDDPSTKHLLMDTLTKFQQCVEVDESSAEKRMLKKQIRVCDKSQIH